MRRILTAALSVTLVLALAVPAAAGGNDDRRRHHGRDVVDVVLAVSGSKGFDRNPNDYDLLRESLVATGLADDLKAAKRITVWAPKDRAFTRLARDLGWKGSRERWAFRFLARNVGTDVLADVLQYHVTPRKLSARDVTKLAKRDKPLKTLLGPTIKVTRGLRLIDKEPDLRNPRIVPPINVRASNGIIHTINRVLIPVDLP
jgi:uncharacterized surface protein with fasciclin (FAS1) repeats